MTRWTTSGCSKKRGSLQNVKS